MIYFSLFFFLLSLFLLFLSYFVVFFNKTKKKDKNLEHEYCILIPARNESEVIEELLISILNQTEKISPKDVYVIVEDPNDLTVLIVKKYQMNLLFRKDLTKRRKGYALDDIIKEILQKKKKYSAYFIFDADNVLDKNYIKEMKKTILEGYDIGVGYRNVKNGNTYVSLASALTFTMINTLSNTRKTKYSNTITISGTGYYIKGDLIEKWGGFPFTSLTEDYELTLYATLNNLTTFYNTKAIFYDEQPESYSVSLTQRSRWIKGYFEARKKYIKKIRKSICLDDFNFASKVTCFIGVRPYIYLILSILFFLVACYFHFPLKTFLLLFFFTIFLLYFFLVVISFYMVKKEENQLKIGVSKGILALYYPIFLFGFLVAFLISLFNKNLTWKEIKHTKRM